jgi:uncharacterized protein (TIGR03437 family)
VLFDGVPAALVAVAPGRIDAQAPYETAGRAVVEVEVRCGDGVRARAEAAIAEAAPGIFTAGGGTGQALALNQDGSLNSEANPAPKGSIVSFFATGEGRLAPAAATGVPAQAPYGKPVLPVRLSIGRQEVEILYAGAAPGLVGVMQINARMPAGFVPTGALAVELTVGAARSQSGATIALK